MLNNSENLKKYIYNDSKKECIIRINDLWLCSLTIKILDCASFDTLWIIAGTFGFNPILTISQFF